MTERTRHLLLAKRYRAMARRTLARHAILAGIAATYERLAARHEALAAELAPKRTTELREPNYDGTT